MQAKRFVDWSFDHYLGIAHPGFVDAPPAGTRASAAPLAALAG
jgi:hypothetical protein